LNDKIDYIDEEERGLTDVMEELFFDIKFGGSSIIFHKRIGGGVEVNFEMFHLSISSVILEYNILSKKVNLFFH